MTEEYWRSSQLSMAQFYGCISADGHDYIIVNKDGKDIFECSAEADRAGRDKAIEPGEPADLCRSDFVKYYKKLGRERFHNFLREHRSASDKELLQMLKKINDRKDMKCYFNNKKIDDSVCTFCTLRDQCVAYAATKQEKIITSTSINLYI